MITKIKRLRNIGKFYDYGSKGDGLDWKKKTFLFAPNAYGKSTLVNVLRSLRDSNAKIISSRKTVNASGPAEAVIIADGNNHVFGNAKWDKSLSTVHIFDTSFIHDNILARDIEHEHKKNMHRIIIGEQGVKLAQELSAIKSREKDRSKHLEDGLIRQFTSGGFTQTLHAFLAIPATAEVGITERIKKLEGDIKAKESEETVRGLPAPTTLTAPAYDVAALKTVLVEKVSTIHEEAEKLVLAQIEKNIKDKEQAKDFISQGLDLLQLDCPFCGQDLQGATDLISAYRQYFDDSFRTYQGKIDKEADAFEKWNVDNELTTLDLTNTANVAAAKQWGPFLEITPLPDIPSVEGLRTKLKELMTKIQAEIEKKQKDPNLAVDLSSLDELTALLSAQKTAVDEYNAAIAAFNDKTKTFVANLPASGIDALKRDLTKEREVEKRFKLEWKKWATDYEATKKEVADLQSNKEAKQKELETYTKTIFQTHQKRINELLLTLGADFAITDLSGKIDGRANEAYSDFAFLILQKKVPLTTRQDDSPCFKNTLSEGDKSTLAFAFFIATIEHTQYLDKQIIILDDPLSSLDENRREATARVLLALSPKVDQLCVFTHKKDFLWMLCDKMPDCGILQIRSDKKSGSWLEELDVEQQRKSPHARLMDEMERYITEDFGPAPDVMQGNIRKIFEAVLKTKYYLILKEDMKNKKGFAKLLETLFNGGYLDSALKPKLFDLCSLTSGVHHGEIVDATERTLTRDELIPLIPEALALVEKV